MIALVKKLTREIIDCFSNSDEPIDLSYFTEKKLRPLTLMRSDGAKVKRFGEMQNMKTNQFNEILKRYVNL